MLLYYSTFWITEHVPAFSDFCCESANHIISSCATNRFGPDAHIHVPDISPHRFLHAFDTWPFLFWTIRSRKPAVGLVAPWSCVVWKLSPCWSSSWGDPSVHMARATRPGSLRARFAAATGNATRYMAASRWRCHREERGSGWLQSWIISFRVGNLHVFFLYIYKCWKNLIQLKLETVLKSSLCLILGD